VKPSQSNSKLSIVTLNDGAYQISCDNLDRPEYTLSDALGREIARSASAIWNLKARELASGMYIVTARGSALGKSVVVTQRIVHIAQ
jgi:hypothetical protein